MVMDALDKEKVTGAIYRLPSVERIRSLNDRVIVEFAPGVTYARGRDLLHLCGADQVWTNGLTASGGHAMTIPVTRH